MNRSAPKHASITSPDWEGAVPRLTLAGYLVAVALCSVLAFVGVLQADWGCLVLGIFAGLGALLLRGFLRNLFSVNDRGGVGEEAVDVSEINCETEGVTGKVVSLAEDLKRLGELESARGTRRFDAWEWQARLCDLRHRVRDDVELRRLLGLKD